MKKPELASATAAAFPVKPTWPSSLKPWQIKALQRALNAFCKKYLDGLPPLLVDGKMGIATRRRIRRVKFYLGQVRPKPNYNTKVNRQFVRRLGAPNNERLVVSKHPHATVVRGQKRRRRHNVLHRQNGMVWDGKPNATTYDGVPIADFFVPINNWARNVGYAGTKWRGRVVSGLRTKEYSRHLCIGMCGAPTCPGRCAGEFTNHVGIDPKGQRCGAEDVSDYQTFRYLMQHCPFQKLHAPRIFNNLPVDPVHFSPRGN